MSFYGYVPCNEENLAFLAIFISCEVKIKDSIATFIARERVSEILVGFIRSANLVNNHLLLFYPKDNKSVDSF